VELRGKTIVVTGATGQVGLPVAKALAGDNEVLAAARFKDAAAREAHEAAGVRCVPVDLATGDVAALPVAPDAVLHFAVAKSNRWNVDLTANAEGTGLLMAQCREATAFLHCSSGGVYQPQPGRVFTEDDPLGDNHRASPWLETYSISKIASEAVARTCARLYDLPTVIPRLSVPYGDHGGWPLIQLDMAMGGMAVEVHDGEPSRYNPIHEDDIVAHLPALLDLASVPATTVNWGGDDEVSVQEWAAYLTELTGVAIELEAGPHALPPIPLDLTRQHELVGHTTVAWRDGFRHMIEANHPELLH
jgi:nucleoside-diphosphate-sugar epimerase